jgi:hypothetical protein
MLCVVSRFKVGSYLIHLSQVQDVLFSHESKKKHLLMHTCIEIYSS